MRSRFSVLLLAAIVAGAVFASPRPASAHLATFGSWEVTRDYLKKLFPEADKFLVKKDEYSDSDVEKIEKFLGFELYPEDRNPRFYVALDTDDGKKKFLGVAMFIDPRVKPKLLDGKPVRLEVGVAVDGKGKVSRVRVFDYKGDLELTKPPFLDQLRGLKLGDDFTVGEKVEPVEGEEEESQLVANAAREALYLMKISLGSK